MSQEKLEFGEEGTEPSLLILIFDHEKGIAIPWVISPSLQKFLRLDERHEDRPVG